jgi:hypothetical protein
VPALAAGCGGSSGEAAGTGATTHKAYALHINPADFTTTIDNKYFPLKPGTTVVYQGKSQDATEHDEMVVTSDTKKVMGVECVVVNDKVTEGGKLIEQTLDWYAQDKEGTVWYFGEESKEYESGNETSTEGSWEAGKDGAKPAIIMPGSPEGRTGLPPGVPQGCGRSHGAGSEPQRVGSGALWSLRLRANDQGLEPAQSGPGRAQVLRGWSGQSTGSVSQGSAGAHRTLPLPACAAHRSPEPSTIAPEIRGQAAHPGAPRARP